MLSTHLAGGCFQYSNEIITNWPGNKELVMPDITNEHHSLHPDWTIKYYGHSTLLRSLSLICCISRILINALLGRYSGLLIFGNARWDYIVLKYWQLTKLPSYCVVHDGKMHTGEKNSADGVPAPNGAGTLCMTEAPECSATCSYAEITDEEGAAGRSGRPHAAAASTPGRWAGRSARSASRHRDHRPPRVRVRGRQRS